MKVHWRFNDLAGAIERGQLELWDPTGDASSAGLTASMSKVGIPEGTLVRGALPRRALPRRADSGGADSGGEGGGGEGGGGEHGPLFHADPPVNFKRPFENQIDHDRDAHHSVLDVVRARTTRWSRCSRARWQVLSCQVAPRTPRERRCRTPT